MTPSGVRLIFALHNHQPVGNFDEVFEAAYRDSYSPFLGVMEDYPEIPFVLHTSGPLMEWILTSGFTQEEAAFVQEPDFFIPRDITPRVEHSRLDRERTRLQTHFLTAERRLVRDTRSSLALAYSRLGDRVNTEPPSPG